MAGSISATPEQEARLKQIRIQMMEQSTKIQEAELIAAGRLDEASQLRRQTERQIREMSDSISTALERPVGALNDQIVGADPYKYFDLEKGIAGSIAGVTSLGLYTEGGYDLGAGAANIYLPEESEMRGLKEKTIMDALEADPEMARPAVLQYHTDLFKTAVESAFPQADANALSASYMGLIAGIEGIFYENASY